MHFTPGPLLFEQTTVVLILSEGSLELALLIFAADNEVLIAHFHVEYFFLRRDLFSDGLDVPLFYFIFCHEFFS